MLAGGAAASSQLAWFDRTGKLLELIGAPGQMVDGAISPDEKTIAFRGGRKLSGDLWLRNLSRENDLRLTSAKGTNGGPLWSPAGDRIVFNSNRSGAGFQLYQIAANGSGQEDLLFPDTNNDFPNQWSRDGQFIVYTHVDAKTLRDIWVFPIGKSRTAGSNATPIPFLHSGFNEQDGQLSPDSKWMAFSSDASGPYEIYVRPFPSGEGEWRVSAAGGNQPRWRGDGKELFFVAGNGKMTAVAVPGTSASKSSLEFGASVTLFDAHMPDHNFMFNYDVTADGKRFLVETNTAASSVAQLTVVVNWQAGLKK